MIRNYSTLGHRAMRHAHSLPTKTVRVALHGMKSVLAPARGQSYQCYLSSSSGMVGGIGCDVTMGGDGLPPRWVGPTCLVPEICRAPDIKTLQHHSDVHPQKWIVDRGVVAGLERLHLAFRPSASRRA